MATILTSKPNDPAAFSAIVMARKWGSGLPFRRIGDSESIQIKNKAKEMRRASGEVFGGTHSLNYMLEEMAIEFNQSDFTLENITRAFFGDSSIQGAASHVDVEFEAYPASFIELCPKPTNVIVKNAAGTVFVRGKDYIVNSGGIEIIDGTTIVAANASTPTAIKISWDSPNVALIQTFTNNVVCLEMKLLAKNNIGNQGASTYHIYKVQFDPVAAVDLVSSGGKQAELKVTGKALADTSVDPGDSDDRSSQFMSITTSV